MLSLTRRRAPSGKLVNAETMEMSIQRLIRHRDGRLTLMLRDRRSGAVYTLRLDRDTAGVLGNAAGY